MAKIFWVDLPNPFASKGDEESWKNVDTFWSRQEALDCLAATWGIEPENAGLFITEGEDGEPDDEDNRQEK